MTQNEDRLLVPVDESVTLRETVAYAVGQLTADHDESEAPAAGVDPAGDSEGDEPGAADDGTVAEDPDEPTSVEGDGPTIHFVVFGQTRVGEPGDTAEIGAAEELLERVALWAAEDAGDATLTVETRVAGVDRYLFGPDQYADAILEYASRHGFERVLLDPEYTPASSAPMLWPLGVELDERGLTVEEAPVERQRRATVLARSGTARKYVAVFFASFAFYLGLGGTAPFELVTGVATAALVAALLAPISFGRKPRLRRLATQVARLALFVPYLVYEIAVANLHIARVVLSPSLPIDPEVVRFRAAVWGDTPVTTLANSITLTPGTLTVDVADQTVTVHTLTEPARSALMGGSLERAVRFLFLGRGAMSIPGPAERGARQFPGGDVAGEGETDADSSTTSTGEPSGAGDGTDGSDAGPAPDASEREGADE